MYKTRWGEVKEIISEKSNLTELLVEVEGRIGRAVNYPDLTGKIAVGDRVILNTTAVDLNLGTGGKHFVILIKDREERDLSGSGHIMKMRYTPWQIKCLTVEERDSPYHQTIKNFVSLEGMPVIVGSLHSMLPLALAGYYSGGGRGKTVYLMTDGGALPLAFSQLVHKLKEKGLLNTTITVGHAFGGDLEGVNVYTGLIAAKEVVKADLILVMMGPGVVGTGTPYGFTGIEQGEIVNSVNILGGRAIAIPRISFSDSRDRHYGISHHTLTALGKVALSPALIPLPKLTGEKRKLVWQQLEQAGITSKHQVIEIDEDEKALNLLKNLDISVTTMGRDQDEEKEFFQTCIGAGRLVEMAVEKVL